MSQRFSRRMVLGLAVSGALAGCGPAAVAGPSRVTTSPTPLPPTAPVPAATNTRTTRESTPTAAAAKQPTGLPTTATPVSPVATESLVPATSVPSVVPTVPPAPIAPADTGLGVFPLPTRVHIPRIKVNAPVETVGLEASGIMEKPSAADVVAWYGYGPAPGAPGASVLAGHVDSVRGPAVFWSLQDLRSGDTIEVEVLGHPNRRFQVVEAGVYPPDAAPIDVIFASGGPPRLNLITCGGVFDRSRHAYDKRLVVYTQLVTSSASGGAHG